MQDINKPVNELNCDLEKVCNRANQWKMQFNRDSNKQANKIIFSPKSKPVFTIHLLNENITKCPHQKHLGIVLDLKLNFNTNIDHKIKKSNKLIGLTRRPLVKLPRCALLTIYRSFIRPHLDYGDIFYDKPDNENFQNKIVYMAITGAIQGTSREKHKEELELDTLLETR